MPHYPGVERHGNYFRYVIMVPDRRTGKNRRQRIGKFPTAKAAHDARKAAVEAMDKGVRLDTAKVTVEQYITKWLRGISRLGSGISQTTVEGYEFKMGYILPLIGHLLLRDLTKDVVLDLYDDLLRGDAKEGRRAYAFKTVVGAHLALHLALEEAVETGLLYRNPCHRARPKPPVDSVPDDNGDVDGVVLTLDEGVRFLAHLATDRLFALWHLFLATGLRRGEAAGLRWPDVEIDELDDSGRGTITVVRQRVRSVKLGIIEKNPKTKGSKATMLISSELVDSLREHRRHQKEERLSAGPGWTGTNYVFTKPNGKPLRPGWITEKCAELSVEAGVPRATPQALRRTVATALSEFEEAGRVSLLGIRDQLRHTSTSAVTEKHYIKGRKPLNGPAAALLGELFPRPEASGS